MPKFKPNRKPMCKWNFFCKSPSTRLQSHQQHQKTH